MRRVWAPALALGLLACGRPPLRPAATERPAADAAAPPPSASASAAPSAGPVSAATPLPDGCWSQVRPTLDAEAKLAALAAECVAGMNPILSPPAVLALAAGERRAVPFSVDDPTRCLRVIAAAAGPSADLEVTLLGPDGRTLAADALVGAFAVVAERGPVCGAQPGTYQVAVTAPGRAATVALQVWRAH